MVFVELFESVKDPEQVWQDLRGGVEAITDLPTVANQPVRPQINKDFGETVALMLTISSPKVSNFRNWRAGPEHSHDAGERISPGRPRPSAAIARRPCWFIRTRWAARTSSGSATASCSGSPSTGSSKTATLSRPPSTACLDFQLVAGKTDDELIRRACFGSSDTIRRRHVASRHMAGHHRPRPGRRWPRAGPVESRDPLDRPDRYSYRELRSYADVVRDRLKQYPTIGKIDEIGTQNEAVHLYYSGRRFNGLDLLPQTIAGLVQRRNINQPGGRVERPRKTSSCSPAASSERTGIRRRAGHGLARRTIPPVSATWWTSFATTRIRRG